MIEDTTPKSRITEFVTSLRKLVVEHHENRAALAKLRTGLGVKPSHALAQYEFVIPFLDQGREPDEAPNTWFFVVGALFAWHPQRSSKRASLGEALRQLKAKQGSSESIEKRFAALLASDEQELPTHLRQIVGLLRTNEIPVDWHTLLSDLVLTGWNRSDRKVQAQWARDYYRKPGRSIEIESRSDSI